MEDVKEEEEVEDVKLNRLSRSQDAQDDDTNQDRRSDSVVEVEAVSGPLLHHLVDPGGNRGCRSTEAAVAHADMAESRAPAAFALVGGVLEDTHFCSRGHPNSLHE